MKMMLELIIGDPQADRAVPPTGTTARLTVFAAGVMAFLAVIAIALSLSASRVADRWAEDLAQSSTLRLPADPAQADALLLSALEVLQTTPGVASVRALSPDEQRALLEPWFGPDLPERQCAGHSRIAVGRCAGCVYRARLCPPFYDPSRAGRCWRCHCRRDCVATDATE